MYIEQLFVKIKYLHRILNTMKEHMDLEANPGPRDDGTVRAAARTLTSVNTWLIFICCLLYECYDYKLSQEKGF